MKLTAMTVSLRVPCRAGSARKLGRSMMVYSGAKPSSSRGLGPHQQGADEQVVPGQFVDHPHLDAMLGLRAAEQVGDVELVLLAKRGEEIRLERGEMFRRHGDVGLAPPDGVRRLRIADDELVLGRSAGVLAGLHHQRTVRREHAFTVADRVFDQRRRAEIGEDRGPGGDALPVERVTEHGGGQRFLHEIRQGLA